VRNHYVLYVDLIGTCYDVLTKPMPLMQRHVDIFRHKVIMGVHNRLRRDKHGDPVESAMSERHVEDASAASFSAMDHLEINEEIPIDDPSQVVLHKEMFIDIRSPSRELRVS